MGNKTKKTPGDPGKKTPTVAKELLESTLTWDAASFGRQIVENQQYYLMRNMGEIAGSNKNYYGKGYRSTAPGEVTVGTHSPGNPAPQFKTQYKSFVPIESTSNIEPMKVYTKLVGASKSDTSTFTNLTAAQQALLVPTLRLFKLHYPPDKHGKPDTQKSPIEKEIIFDDYTVGSSPDLIHLHKKGKLAGSGIKSFRWSLKGVNPAEVDRNIEAELVIFFNNVSDIFVDAEGIPTYEAGKDQASFLDLIIHSVPKEEREHVNTRQFCPDVVYDGAFFELKVVVGWSSAVASTNPRSGGATRTLDDPLFDAEQLQAIENSQKTMYLQLTKHKFNFNMDGSATLTINYRARYNFRDTKYDILGVDVAGLNVEIKEAEAEIKKLQNRGVSAEAVEAFRTKRMGPLNEKRLEALGDRYSKIFKALAPHRKFITVSAADLGIFDPTGKGEAITGEQLKQFVRGGSLINPLAGDVVTDVNILNPGQQQRRNLENSSNVAIDPNSVEGKYLAGMEQSLQGGYSSALDPPSSARRELTMEEYRAGARYGYEETVIARAASGANVNISVDEGSLVTSLGFDNDPLRHITGIPDIEEVHLAGTGVVPTTGEFDIAYFYFGDILEAIIMANVNFYDLLHNRIMGIILTDAQYLDPKATMVAVQALLAGRPATHGAGIGSNMWKCGFNKLPRKEQLKLIKTIPIANIPIHFAEFYSWFVRKVIKPARDVYFFEDFISDLITEFVAPALSGASFTTYMPPVNVNLSYVGVDIDAGSKFTHGTYPKVILPGGSQTSWGYSIGKLISEKMIPLPHTEGGTSYRGKKNPRTFHTTYKIMFVSTLLTAQLTGDLAKDQQAGILHFTVGEPTGLLKSATFDRVDQPYLREGRVDRTRSMSATQLRELYNVTLRLYGTTLLKPGQLIYVVPNEITFGDVTTEGTVARLLGIGGYHLVTSVDSRISESGYETTIKALHQAMPGTE
jgi:hypothetical protein